MAFWPSSDRLCSTACPCGVPVVADLEAPAPLPPVVAVPVAGAVVGPWWARWHREWAHSLRFRFLALGLMPLLVAFPVVIAALVLVGGERSNSLLQANVRSNLAGAHNYLEQMKTQTSVRLAQLVRSERLIYAVKNHQRSRDIDQLLHTAAESSGLDYLVVATAEGQVLASSTGVALSNRLPDSYVIRQARVGVANAAYERFDALELNALSPQFAPRVQDAVDMPAPGQGLLINAAAHFPLSVDIPDTILVGGIVFNKNLSLIEHLREIIYPVGTLPDDSEGVASIFLGAQMVASSRQHSNGSQTLELQPPQEVVGTVLDEQARWFGTHSVAGHNYMLGYQALTNGDGEAVGMISVGFPAAPYQRMALVLLALVSGLLALTMLAISVLFLRAGRELTQRLQAMGDTMNAVRRGERQARLVLPGDRDELAQLGQDFNDLLNTIAEQQAQQQAAQRTIADEAARRRVLFEQARDGVVIIDTQGQVVECNSSGAAMLGYTTDELRQCRWHDWDAQHSLAQIDELLHNVGPQGRFLETLHRRKDGSTYTAEVSLSRAEWAGQTLVFALHRDISQRKAVEEELERYRQNLERLVQERTRALNELNADLEHMVDVRTAQLAAANAAKSEFLANMSHEIRTPMNAVLGLAQLLLDMELAPKQRDYLHKIHQAATTLLGVLNDILDYSKIEAGYLRVEMVPMRLDEVLRNSVTLFEARATEKQLQLDWHIEPQVPLLLEGDPLRLGQVLNNLIGNAIKFTARGSVQVVVSCAQTLPQAVLLKVVVRDTGIGLTAEQISGIFEAFQQADASTTRKYGGTGLGLSISKRLVELMGGEMGVDSEAGQGSRFWFTVRLGVCAPSLLVPTGGRPDSAELPGGRAPAWTEVVATTAPIRGARVLLVDDNATNRLVASEYLDKMGLLVQQAYNGISAVEMATQQPFDAILMDLHMNGMDGFAAARAIRAHPAGQHVPIIALSAAALQRDVAASQAAGMNAHLPKPINALQLARALVQWIAPRSTIAPLAEPQPPADGAAVVAPFQLPGLDLVRAQAALDHDWARLRRVLLSFYRDCVTLPAALDEALQHQQWGDAVRYVHSVKGLAPVVGATALQQVAQRLEAELQQQQAHTYPDFVRLLQQALTAIAPLVQADARTDATPAPSAAPLRAIALDELLTRLCALQPLLASGQVKACGLSTEIALLVAGTEWQQPYAPVAQAIERLDFKAARQHLHNLAHAQHWSLS